MTLSDLPPIEVMNRSALVAEIKTLGASIYVPKRGDPNYWSIIIPRELGRRLMCIADALQEMDELAENNARET